MAEPQKQQKQQKTKTVTGKKNTFVANDFAKNLGTCAAIRATFNLGNFVGKGNSAKELAANTKIPNMEDVYEIACVGLPEESWKGKSVDAIFNYLAAKKTLHVYKEAGKKVVTQKGEEITDEAVLKNPAIMKDSSGKAYYQKYKREMFAEFESGIDAARTELMQGKPITDPYTKEKVDASKASKILNGVGKAVSAAGSQIGYILGLDKSNKDIYSKMLFSVIGGGSKLWAAAKKAAATAKAKQQEQGKEKPAEAKPEEQNKEAPAEEQKNEAPAEEPKKEPEGQANNPEGEEPQTPKVSNENKENGKKIKDELVNYLKEPNSSAWDKFQQNCQKFIIKVLGKNTGNLLPALHNAFVKAKVLESMYADSYISFILTEQMLELLEDEQENQQNAKQVEQQKQKETTYTEKVKSLIQQIISILSIADENEFQNAYAKWHETYEKIVEVIAKNDSKAKDKAARDSIPYLFSLLEIAKKIDAKNEQMAIEKAEEAKLDEETSEVANKFLNMLREKYK